MRLLNKILVSALGLSLLFSQGLTTAEAKSHDKKSKTADKNKNGIDDKWEKKYKLSGKNVAGQDNDKDSLSNLIEYKLTLHPKTADTDKDGTLDGQEDRDKDGVGNLAEIENGLDPLNPDTDKDKIKDGEEKDKDGVLVSNKVQDLEIKIVTADKKSITVDYKVQKKKATLKVKDTTGTVTNETITALVKELQEPNSKTQEEVVAALLGLFKIEGPFGIEMEIEYADGKELEIEEELEDKDEDDDEDDDDDHDEDDHDDHNDDERDED
ncbi:hypothetical protein [Bacillus sp. CECT 9360]|uniref:hypothetical protein n=1 Tax=Bacillus sp. CECT 9360 TaxID=2845821 RepID=UPI001E63DEAD|nr:hypothetical protein [Bacillus sp. CECT 9360]CAH0346444.1 hypothetical protein BCI9360_02779 [Bacillus sp. CECT 9360]